MWRSSLWIIAAITLAGCYQPHPSAPPLDLFQGPSRVPSPGTQIPADQNYYKDRNGAHRASAAGSSSRNEPAEQGAGGIERSVVIDKPAAAKGSIADVNSVADVGAKDHEDHTGASRVVKVGFHAKAETTDQQVKHAANGRPAPPTSPSVIRIVEPTGTPTLPASSKEASSREPGQFTPAKGAVKITDLPQADQWTGIGKTASSGTTVVSMTSPATTGSYGYDKDYSWLKGKLEYARSADRWKLRYVPIDAKTDDHGGSVVLPSDAKLSGFQHGDFVRIDGKLGARDEAADGFAPQYDIASIKKQAE